MSDTDEFCKRTWAAIAELDTCVKEQTVQEGEGEDFEYHNRTYTAAMAITGLGLGLDHLGDIARCLLEMEKIIEEDNPEEKSESSLSGRRSWDDS